METIEYLDVNFWEKYKRDCKDAFANHPPDCERFGTGQNEEHICMKEL